MRLVREYQNRLSGCASYWRARVVSPRRHKILVEIFDHTGKIAVERLRWLVRERLIKGIVPHDSEKADLRVLESCEVSMADTESQTARFLLRQRAATLVKKNSIVDPITGCWLWTAAQRDKKSGYGGITFEGKRMLAHRLSYGAFIGEIPTNKFLDHLCSNRLCINPAHLEPVTLKENAARGEFLKLKQRAHEFKTRCPRGHAYEGNNLYVSPRNQRVCRICAKEAVKKSLRRKL